MIGRRIFAMLSAVLSFGAAVYAAVPAADPRAVRGRQVFAAQCAGCHGTPGNPGTVALATRYKGSVPALLEQRTDLSDDMVKAFVRNGVSTMPPYRKTEISDAELTDLASYLTRSGSARRK